MSRVGKVPIEIKDGVTVSVDGSKIKVSGPKGELERNIVKQLSVEVKDNQVLITPKKENRESRRLHGLFRTLIFNMIIGVSEGFKKQLEFNGVGFRAATEGRDLVMHLGFSHPIKYTPAESLEIKVEKNIITVSGTDKELVGQAAAEIRSLKKPEPYKGKGIKYIDEHIRRKAGKAAAKGD